MRIEDDWLLLRPYTLEDVPDVTAACQDPEISRWTASIPWPYEESHAREWIEIHDQLRAQKAAFPFAIVDKSSGQFLGTIGIHHPGIPPGSAEVAYWVAAWARRRGVATRAVELITTWAFDEFALERIGLSTVVGNTASERVAAKAGYVFVAEVEDWIHPPTGKTFNIKAWVRPGPVGD